MVKLMMVMMIMTMVMMMMAMMMVMSFLGAPDTSDRWVRRIQGREMGSHLKDTRPLYHMYHLLYQMQHLQPVIRRLREPFKNVLAEFVR